MSTLKKQRYFLQSLAKGLSALQHLADVGYPLTLSELAKGIGTTNATATRICFTLTKTGLIRRDKEKRYHLTPNILSLGYSAICAMKWREIARYYLEFLFSEVKGNVNLAILDGSEILYLIHIQKKVHLPMRVRIGSKLPVHSSSAGKVLMALGPPKRIRPVLKRLEFRPLTPNTITNLDEFLHELEIVRKKGYAINHEETSMRVLAVGAPIMNKRNHAIAAINITVSTTDYTREELEETLAPKVLRVAKQISEALHQVEADIIMPDTI